jgi:hypothetical protein
MDDVILRIMQLKSMSDEMGALINGFNQVLGGWYTLEQSRDMVHHMLHTKSPVSIDWWITYFLQVRMAMLLHAVLTAVSRREALYRLLVIILP